MTDLSLPSRTITPKGHLGARVRDIFRYRELLVNLVRKDLKVKYKSSVLGFLWSLLNPAMLLLVYYFVFSVLLGSGIPRFPIYLLSGLLVWNLFNVGFITATGSVVGTSGIVNKVWFPREVLPLSAIGAALVHFFLQGLVMIVTLLIFRHPVEWRYLPMLPFALFALLVFTAALSIFFSAVNVYLRDMQHLVEIALLPWFCLLADRLQLRPDRGEARAVLGPVPDQPGDPRACWCSNEPSTAATATPCTSSPTGGTPATSWSSSSPAWVFSPSA